MSPSELSSSSLATASQMPVLWNPLSWLVFMAILLTIEASWFAYVGAEGPQVTAQTWALVSRVLVAWWVLLDRRARGLGMPFEFEAFVAFVWPYVFAYYMYKTRRAKGLLLALGLWLLSAMPAMVTDVSRLVGVDSQLPVVP